MSACLTRTRWLLIWVALALGSDQALAQDRGSDSGSSAVIYVDPPPVQEDVESSTSSAVPATPSVPTKPSASVAAEMPKSSNSKRVSAVGFVAQGTVMGTLVGAAGLAVGVIGGFALSSQRGNTDHTVLIAVGALGMGTLGLVSGVGLAAGWNRGRCSIWGRVAGGVVGLGLAGVVSEGSPFVGSFMPAMGASIGCYKTYQPNRYRLPQRIDKTNLYKLP